MKVLQGIAVWVGLTLASYSYAETATHHDHYYHDAFEIYHNFLDNEQHQQQEKIQHGIYNGLLSNREVRKLRREQHKIADLICRYEQDRVFSRWEKRRLNKRLHRANRNISRLKHNRVYAMDERSTHRHHAHDQSAYDRNNTYEYADNGYTFGSNQYKSGLFIRW